MMQFWAPVAFTLLFGLCQGALNQDLIKNLPGLSPQPTFQQYSGYLNASDTKRLHYWFVESQGKPATDPLVLWLNGGPGCSSMDGLLSEHGPFLAQEDGKTLKTNPYSWNKVANMLYLEAPVCVGYSYSLDKKCKTDDDQVAKDNHAAIKNFLKGFPEFKSNTFYITGESYGGIYVPTLSARVMDDPSINFKGFAVGNGLSNAAMNDDSLIYFGYYHGLFGDELWGGLVSSCCKGGNETKPNCNFHSSESPNCQNAINLASLAMSGLNIYNLYSECYQQGADQYPAPLNLPSFLFTKNPLIQKQRQALQSRTKNRLSLVPPCIDATGITNYLNLPEVRKAIHIPDFLPKWSICSIIDYGRLYNDMTKQYHKVLTSGKYHVLVYNGDIDMACNFLGDEWFVSSLGLKRLEPRKQWFYTNGRGTKQVAGYVDQYSNLRFVTVKGAGHMVPQNKPVPSLEMFTHFIRNTPY